MEPDEVRIRDLQEAIALITGVQTKLSSWYGPEGNKLMHARQHLEKELNPLIESLIGDPEKIA